MSNPFKHNGEMLPVASINSVYVDDTKAYDLFRPTLIMEELLRHKDQLGITSMDQKSSLLALFQELLSDESLSIRQTARTIAESFGHRLARVLSTLFAPSELSKRNRVNWTEEHWAYWSTIRQVYLVGGLTSPLLTKIFYHAIEQEFLARGIKNVKIVFVTDSQNMGTSGMGSLAPNEEILLFDFGQTNIKRAYLVKEKGDSVIDQTLEPLLSKHLFYKTATQEELRDTANLLDDYMVSIIEHTATEVDFKGSVICVSVANYVSQGRIYEARGGYGKLAYIADNYQLHLEQRLTQLFGRPITIQLHHDTSAMALLYQNQPHTAVLSLGTAFGVAFTDET